MRIVLLHPPALGPVDGLPAMLARALAVPRVHLCDLMRTHLSQATELGVRATEVMNSGMLVPDELITAIVRDGLHRAVPAGFLLDGHPRSAARALALDEVLRELDTPLDGVVYLRLPEAEVERRVHLLAGRRACRSNASHVFAPWVDRLVIDGGRCNVCGGELYQRANDNENSIRGRLRSLETTLSTVAQHYDEQGLLVTVDAVGTPDEMTSRVLAAFEPSP